MTTANRSPTTDRQGLGTTAGVVVHRAPDPDGWKLLAGKLPYGESTDPYTYDHRESVPYHVYNSFLTAPYSSSTAQSLAVILWCDSKQGRSLASTILDELSTLVEFALRQADDL